MHVIPASCAVGTERALRMLAWPGSGAAVGYLAWGGEGGLFALIATIALPALWTRAPSRMHAAAMVLAYFLAGSRGLPGGSAVFFGDTAPAWWGASLWLASGAALTLPFALAWSSSLGRNALGFLLAITAISVPPIGLIGWLNPLTAAGVLFPGLGWLGLILTLAVLGALASWRLKAAAALGLVAGIINIGFILGDTQAKEPEGWLGFDTKFESMGSGGTGQASQLLASMSRIQWLRGVVNDMPAGSTLVLPETVLGRLDSLAESMLEDTQDVLRQKRARVLVGAELPVERSRRYINVVLQLGATGSDSRAAIQGMPVPISMWKPWADDGAQADLLARDSVINVGPQRVGAVVCYEQLLTYSMLLVLMRDPTVLIAPSNVWWARATNIPAIQLQSARAYARLANVPLISARNI